MAETPYNSQSMDLIVNTPDVRVAEITLAPHTDTPPHEHTAAEETCYCLEGELSCEADGHPPTTLRPGQKKSFPPGLDHQLRNRTDAPCRFLLIHNGGRFDFVPTANR